MTFLTKVEDFDGNITELEEKALLTPLFEEMIDKSTWTLMSQLSVNGNAWEGQTQLFGMILLIQQRQTLIIAIL